MLKANVQEALNNQINGEIASTYLYLVDDRLFRVEELSWPGQMDGSPGPRGMGSCHENLRPRQRARRPGHLKQIDAPPSEWKSVLDVFEHTLSHELKVTEKIHALVKLATSECDYATLAFLQWFVSEQVEEEAQTTSIVEKLKLMGDGNIGLFILDGELGKRAAA